MATYRSFFHVLLFSFAFYILWNSSENGNANQIIARWLRCMGAFLWLVPVPGVPFSGLLYISAFYHTHSREHTITYQAFENMKSMFRDPIWPKLKNQFEYEFRKLNFFQRFRSYPFHNSRIQQNTNKKILSCFSLRIRALSSAGTTSWVIWLLFLFKLDFHIIENVYGLLAMISLIFTILSLLVYITQYIVMTVKRKLAFQERPYSYYIFLSQIGFLAGTCISFGYKTNDTIFITPISFVCLILILLKLLQTILGIFIDLPEDEDQIPFESLFFTVILISFITTSRDLPSNSNNPIDRVMIIDKSLRYLLPIFTLLITYNFHSYFMSPFGWNEINTKNLPQKIRILLTIVSQSFVFPFGEFLLPFFIYLKEHYWTKFEKFLIDQ